MQHNFDSSQGDGPSPEVNDSGLATLEKQSRNEPKIASTLKQPSSQLSIRRRDVVPIYPKTEEREYSDSMLRASMFFSRLVYCFCKRATPLEVVLFQQVFKPTDRIEVTLLLGKLQSSVSSISVGLTMELTVYSLTEVPQSIHSFEQDLMIK